MLLELPAHLSLINQSANQQRNEAFLGIPGREDLMVIRGQLLSNCLCLGESYVQALRSNAAIFMYDGRADWGKINIPDGIALLLFLPTTFTNKLQ